MPVATGRVFSPRSNETFSEKSASETYRRYRRVIDEFVGFLAAKADRALDGVTIRDVEMYRDRELGANKRTGSVKTSLAVLNAAFNRARRLGVVLTSPVEGIESIARNAAERRPFTI